MSESKNYLDKISMYLLDDSNIDILEELLRIFESSGADGLKQHWKSELESLK